MPCFLFFLHCMLRLFQETLHLCTLGILKMKKLVSRQAKSTNAGCGVVLRVRRSARTGTFGAKGSRSDIRTYFMHILGQLISSEAALFFISAENSGWVSISLLLIISFAFDLYYGCSVRHSFIHQCWWRDGAFRDRAD